ncbi:MAG: hypothetical protein C0595_10045 [Marinilabiliales bacterium]|nr:MAG: hypothetical protein C0595_10045 [Marinilabiliales bacterium]
MIKSASGTILTNTMLLIIILFTSVNLFGQIANTGRDQLFNPLTDDITERLPALNVLIDSAAHNSPDMLYEELKADYYRYEQISAANEWLDMLSWNVDLNFGKWDYWDYQEQTKDPYFYNSQSWRTNFAFAFYVRMPLRVFIDRRNRINKQKKWIEISLTQKEINRRFLADRVITIYNDLVNYQNQIRIYNEYQGFTMSQMQMAKNEFLNGEITTAEYTRLKEIQIRGSIDYTKVIAEFKKNYDALEIITGMHFNLITIIR